MNCVDLDNNKAEQLSDEEEQKEEDNNDKYKTRSSPKQIKIDHDKYHLLAAKNLSTR